MAPLFPVPRRIFCVDESPMANTRSSREVHSVSGDPSGDIFITSAPPVAGEINGNEIAGCVACACNCSVTFPWGVLFACNWDKDGGTLITDESVAARYFSPMDAA